MSNTNLTGDAKKYHDAWWEAESQLVLARNQNDRPSVREIVCEDCMHRDHEACHREGGYMHDEDNEQRCGCHQTEHALDNRDGAHVLAALLDIPPERRMSALVMASKAYVESAEVRVAASGETPTEDATWDEWAREVGVVPKRRAANPVSGELMPGGDA